MKKEEQEKIMLKFDKYILKGKVNIKNPERIFVIFLLYSKDGKLQRAIYGKEIYGKNEKEMRYYTKFDLIHRKYIGPTSTDHTLSFLMTNFAQIKKYDNIIDPFVGTGSLLIPSSFFQANCFGCDLDIRVLKGYSIGYVRDNNNSNNVKFEGNIFSNFEDYNLIKPQIIRFDINHHSFKKNNFFFDSIICDPPYGWRASSKKTGLSEKRKEKRDLRLIKQLDNKNINNEDFNNFVCDENGEKRLFLPTSHCEINTIYDSLINFAKDCLKKNGLLVFLFPVQKTKDNLIDRPIYFPQDKTFKLKYCCENKNSKIRSRWCLVYQKIE